MMADIDVISVDSEGDSEEHAFIISDTEDDVIFVAKTDAQPKPLSANKKYCDAVNNVPLAASLCDDSKDCIILSTTKDAVNTMTQPKLKDKNYGKQLLTSYDSSDKAAFDLCLKPDIDDLLQANSQKLDGVLGQNMSGYHSTSPDPMFTNVLSASLNEQRTSPDLLQNKQLEIVNSKHVFQDQVDSACSLQSQHDDDDDNCSMVCGSPNDSDAESSSSSSSWSSVDSGDSSSTSSSGSSAETNSDNSSLISQTSVNISVNVLDTSPSIPPTPIFDQLIQFPSLDPDKCTRRTSCDKTSNEKHVSSNLTCQSVSVRNQSGNSSGNAMNTKETSELTPKTMTSQITDSAIPRKRCKLNVNTQIENVPHKQSRFDSCTVLADSLPFRELHGECSLCKKLVDVKLLICCPCDNNCCAQCIKKQITDLLAKGKKGLPKCSSAHCSGIWETDKLAKFLPPMVMAILRKKIDEEMIGDIVKWLVPDGESSKGELDDVLHLPEEWQPMGEYKDYVLVNLLSTTVEYLEIHNLFHMSMHRPRAQIQAIKRVQNPNLWRFYAMKRHIMMKEGKTGPNQPLERRLFHGTKRCNQDSICRDNFDWRLSGVHGTVFGVGSYFACEASYSHRYTDQPTITPSRLRPSMFSSLTMIPRGAPIPIIATQQFANPLPSPWSGLALMTSSDPMLSQEPRKPPAKQVHHHVMFVAKVLTGRFTVGRSGYRRPPQISGDSRECYDSCVNCMENPNIFVIFENSQCYPEYVIEYTNEYYYS